MSEKTLQKRLAELRSKSLREANGSEKEIRKLYKKILKDLQGFIGTEYAQYSKDGTLTYSMLQQKGEYARFLEEVTQRLDGITPEISNEIRRVVSEVYELNYKGMVDAVSNSKDTASLAKELKSVKANTSSVIKKAIENPIDKLTLSDTLEHNRQNIIYNIRKQISIGLVNGDRYNEMAKRIASSLDGDYAKSIRVARTETHRVKEQGLNDAAVDCNNAISKGESGLIMVKVWNTGRDARVRDTHSRMEGKIALADEEFELPSGAVTKSPGNSGVASEDINCRCFLTYKLMTVDEYEKATGNDYKNDSKLSKEDEEVIKNYAGIYGNEINSYMYGNSNYITPYEEEIAEKLHNILNKQSLPQEATYYRGQSSAIFGAKRDEILKDPQKAVGETFTNKAFMSTSSNMKSAEMFYSINDIGEGNKPILFVIKAPKGSKGLDISNISEVVYEHETLFIDNSRLKVEKVVEKEDKIVFSVKLLK